jgi:orotidine-5'-phosphate decarboxylase
VTVASAEHPREPVGARDHERFGDRLAERVALRESQIVLGLDPDPMRLWPAALSAVTSDPAALRERVSDRADLGEGASELESTAWARARAARAVAAHCALVIDAAGEHCVAVKLQVACFERLGAPGWTALAQTARLARERGLLVIADAKRGDVEVTATAYAQALLGETPTPFGPVAGLGVDAMTVNPLLGRESLEPFLAAARPRGRGLFVLVRTSNPGAADLQERELAGGGSVSDRFADLVNEIGREGTGAGGLTDVGAVVGATAPARLSALRERMPRAVFLLPGVGAQGGRVEDLAPAFAPGPAGGLVSVSRGIVAAHEHAGGDPATAAAREARRLRELAWRLTA